MNEMAGWISTHVSDDVLAYFEKWAEIRNVRRSRLIQQLLEAVAKDDMINAVIDDTGVRQGKGAWGYRPSQRRRKREIV